MNDTQQTVVSEAPVLTAAHLARWVDHLTGVDTTAPDAALIDQISELERLKSACAAAQAALTVAFVTSRTTGLSTTQLRDERTRRSINAQIALARRDSPIRGGRHVGLATALTREMPHAYTALAKGHLSEWRATLLLRETACLSAQDRTAVDTELADAYPTMGDRQTAAAAARIAQRIDPEHWVARHRKAITDRRVTIRPAPDTMSNLGALLDVAHGVAVYAALNRYATTAKATGDPRTRQQLMADELVTRITNPAAATHTGEPFIRTSTTTSTATAEAEDDQANRGDSRNRDDQGSADRGNHTDGNGDHGEGDHSDPKADDGHGNDDGNSNGHSNGDGDCHSSGDGDSSGGGDDGYGPDDDDLADDTDGPGIGAIPPGVGIDIQLIMTDRTLLDGDNEPAHLTGYGPIPAPLARRLLRGAGPTITTWVRRLFTDPDTGHLITADTRRRTFSHSARQFLIARDQSCRIPYCDAPIRHGDHITPDHQHGPTHPGNGQGACENCNYTKEAPGWQHRADPDGIGITITTPTGHTTHSNPPPPPRSQPWAESPAGSAAPPAPTTPGPGSRPGPVWASVALPAEVHEWSWTHRPVAVDRRSVIEQRMRRLLAKRGTVDMTEERPLACAVGSPRRDGTDHVPGAGKLEDRCAGSSDRSASTRVGSSTLDQDR